ncbi:uncharacterized protein LOC143249112 isoform X2 [Tachypleus tridentatus]|uniref:uncharacterized protein LOC143249112 isoform X2 n=1 Tax=Tachypleus tridentatus TaxID=6853 RepID=UPI003FD06EE5
MNGPIFLSDYAKGSSHNHRDRYIDKISAIKINPYLILPENFTSFIAAHPKPDIYHYFINTTSSHTGERLKSYKSLEAYNFFIAGVTFDFCGEDTYWNCEGT